MKRILVSGGTGLVGARLCEMLVSKGYEVALLSRRSSNKGPYPTYGWDIAKGTIDEEAFENIDAIVHLAGAGIADQRWSKQRKQVILESRVNSTQLLFDTVQKLDIPLKAFVAASATGYYGSLTSETIFEENDAPASDFLGMVCKQWEEASAQFNSLGIRTVVLRTGIVLSAQGGALAKMKTPVISPLGNGKQYMPWIHIDDLCTLYCKSIEEQDFSGPYNAVTGEHNTNYSFAKALAKIFKRPFLPLGVPSFLLKLVFGEMACILLKGSRVSSAKLEKTDFTYLYPTLHKALQHLKTNA